MDVLDGKLAMLQRELEATGGVMVAFPGGADSAFLLAAAVQALGELAVAATGVSPSPAEHELSDARALAALDLEGFRSGSMNALLGDQAP